MAPQKRKITYALKSHALTDKGGRSRNEDVFAMNDRLGAYLLCDGMGGAAGGEYASAFTSKEIMNSLYHAANLHLKEDSFNEPTLPEEGGLRNNEEAEILEFAVKKDCQQLARDSLNKVLNLIQELRDDAGSHSIRREAHDFAEAVKETISELTFSAKKQNIQIRFEGPTHLIGLFDRQKIDRVLTNLCFNACEAIQKPSGMVTVSLLHNDHAVWIDVSDTGEGIEEKNLENIFKKGFTKGKKRGTGLGLAYCKQIIEAHGGSIGVSSQKGKGTIFTLVFPKAAIIFAEEILTPLHNKAFLQAYLLDEENDHWEPWMRKWNRIYGSQNITLRDSNLLSSGRIHEDPTMDPNDDIQLT